ncbi:MAG TPA: FAD:protein FMN transferase [Candidatus Polarisedimenticolaceae bacterium]|nr:FAD:protein FMN transferase [Candidatus Polarisedimenticolaceae bacterium]
MRRAVAATLAAACASACAIGRTERSWPVMGTYARVAVSGGPADARERAIAIARAAFDEVNASMSNWSETSELARVNREARSGTARVDDAELAACLAAALDAAEATGGAFDPTVGPLMTLWGFRPRRPRVPTDEEIERALAHVGSARVVHDRDARAIRFEDAGMELDLGGIAKGCALDLAAARLRGERGTGLRAITLDLGGGMMALDGRGAAIGLADPEDAERGTLATIRLPGDRGVATSSDAENRFESDGIRYGHLMDARTGRPAATDVLQATAVHPAGTTSDLLSTALFVAGSRGAAEILRRYPGAEAVLIVREGGRLAMIASASLSGRLSLAASARERFTPDSPRFTLPPATMPAPRP